MPFNTRRSSTRATPRGLFGNNGWIIDHSTSVRSNRAISKLPQFGSLNHISPLKEIPFMGTVPKSCTHKPKEACYINMLYEISEFDMSPESKVVSKAYLIYEYTT